ncbi:flavodoxin domain-containing protein [Guggenheimella bovis]
MKTLIIYKSETGFTEKYAHWLGERVQGEVMKFNDAKRKDDAFFQGFDRIVYAGWAMAGSISGSDWFKKKLSVLKGKRLALLCVGAAPGDTEETREALEKMLTSEERKLAEVFYVQGGLNYERMPLHLKLAMRAFTAMMKKKKPEETEMIQMLSSSYDCSDPKYLEPLIEYLTI